MKLKSLVVLFVFVFSINFIFAITCDYDALCDNDFFGNFQSCINDKMYEECYTKFDCSCSGLVSDSEVLVCAE